VALRGGRGALRPPPGTRPGPGQAPARLAAPPAARGPHPRAARDGKPVSRPAAPSLWRSANFMRLWSATAVSEVGSQVSALALPLIAILALHASPFEVGLLGACQLAPFLVLGLPAG